MVMKMNINNGIKEPTHGPYQKCINSQISIVGGYVKVR